MCVTQIQLLDVFCAKNFRDICGFSNSRSANRQTMHYISALFALFKVRRGNAYIFCQIHKGIIHYAQFCPKLLRLQGLYLLD